MQASHLTIILFCLFGIVSSGCQAVTNIAHNPFAKIPTASKNDPVVEMICLWEPAEGLGLDNLPSRGFAGQILFFTSSGTEPVKVDGEVQVYVFDDLGTAEEQTKPIHRFDFDKDSFQAFLTQTNLGYAYQLFLPYTKKHGHKTTCSIRVRVTPEQGRPVYSKMASVILSGTEAPTVVDDSLATAARVQQASFEAQADHGRSRPTTAEAAAYFDGASLPVQHVDTTNSDRERLRSTLSKVVQDSQATQLQQQHSHQHRLPQQTNPTQQRHPLEQFDSSDPSTVPALPSSQRHPLEGL